MIGLHPTCYTTSAYLQINLLMFMIGTYGWIDYVVKVYYLVTLV